MANAPSTTHIHAPLKGIACGIVAMSLFPAQDAIVKWLSADYSVFQLLFMRSVFVFIPVAILVMRSGGPRVLRTKQPFMLILGAWSVYFIAILQIPLADAMALVFSAPLIITALSLPFLGEAVGLRRWAAVVVGFLGVLTMIESGSGTLQGVALLPLISAVLYSVSMILTRILTKREASVTMLFYSTLTVLVLSAVALPFIWVTPDWFDLGLMAVMGLLTGAAQYFATQAYRYAAPAVVAPFDYTSLIWATLFGYLLFGDIPRSGVILGAAVVIASGLFILYRERKKAAGGAE
ncbi:MAG: DMT family transporter [Alphaproteobacteria bacterium]